MQKRFLIVVLFFISVIYVHAQTASDVKWFTPDTVSFPVIGSQMMPNKTGNRYERLPDYMKDSVRAKVWDLSFQNTGYIDINTNSSNVYIKMKLSGGGHLPNMADFGTSGVDLYAKGNDGSWYWAPGAIKFGDTATFNFKNIATQQVRFLRIYLPLYNHVQALQIGVDASAQFAFIEQKHQDPIIVYGTSIAQGASASRPGIAWTNILGRKLNSEVINLGFSGNGILEGPLLRFIAQQKAKLIVLDCLPNMLGEKYPQKAISDSVEKAVAIIRSKQKTVPILLVEHSGGNDAAYSIAPERNKTTKAASEFIRKSFEDLKKRGEKNIYLLPSTDFMFDTESTIDGVHPSDHGMVQMANTYYKKISEILTTH